MVRASLNVVTWRRSCSIRPRSMSASESCGQDANHSPSATSSPSSWMRPCPSQARSVVDPSEPVAEKTWAATQRSDYERATMRRSSASLSVVLLAEMFTSKVAPASAPKENGGVAVHRSSQTSR